MSASLVSAPRHIDTRPEGLWAIAWRRFRRDRFAMAGLAVVLVLFAVSLLAPWIASDRPLLYRENGRTWHPAFRNDPALRGVDFKEKIGAPGVTLWFPLIPWGPLEQDLEERLQPPSARHWMGTDNLGRDVLSRMIHGAGVSLKVGFLSMGIALAIGLAVGAIAGYFGGMIDLLISRLIEMMMCFPTFFLILTIIAFRPPSIYNIMGAIGLVAWTGIARYTRAEFLKLREQDFAVAARALGASNARIILRHILPNALAPALVTASFMVASAILAEAGLSFLGFGVPPPAPTWGGILSLARQYIEIAWWLATFPGIAIFVTVTAYQLVGEGLRDAIDPKQYRGH